MEANLVKVIPLQTREDDRGFLFEIARTLTTEDLPHDVIERFGQVYLVGNHRAGTVRGYHKHQFTWDYFCIVAGVAKFVFAKPKSDNPNEFDIQTVVASARQPKLICVPPQVWHGWTTLEEGTLLISIASEPYNHGEPDEVRMGIETLPVDVWTVRAR
jgi:dTDP-4-dehydrorhamnose 3,5-epimerase